MESKDKKEFMEIMLGIAEDSGVQLTKSGIALKFEALREYSIDQIRSAAIHIIKTREHRFMPTTAEFIRAIVGDLPRLADIATEQAGKVIEAVRRFGRYRNPKFKNQVTAALLSSRWSWGRLCEMTESELGWFAKEFVDAYRAFDIVEKRPAIEMTAELKKLTQGIGK